MAGAAAELAEVPVLAAAVGAEAGRGGLFRAGIIDGLTGRHCIQAGTAANIGSFPSAPVRAPVARTSTHAGIPMPHTLRAAAKAVGRDRTTLLRAIRAGKLSAIHDAATGSWLIEPAELHRVYSPVNGPIRATGEATEGDAQLCTTDPHGRPQGETQGEMRELRARLADKDAVIEDLRRRLDAESEERRRLTLVLADMRTAPPVAPPPRRFWWPWGRQ
jgi:hypothetical protein